MTSSRTPQAPDGWRGLPWRRLALIGIVLPLVAAAVLVWATTDRPQNLDRVPVAVVNNDKIIQKPQPMAAGRSLAASLTQPSSDQTNLDWTLADTADAAAGLANGGYYAVLTIPPDFSKSVLSTGTDTPVQGKLQLVSNGAASTTVPFISEAIAVKAAALLGQQATQSYLGQVYDGFNQLASSNKKAASNGHDLASGTAQVSTGATQVDSGAQQLASGLGQLANGAHQLSSASDALSSGADTLAGGARNVANGANGVYSGARDLTAGTRALARSQSAFARSASDVATGSAKVARGAKALSLANRALARDMHALARRCERSGASQRFCTVLSLSARGAGRVADGAGKVAVGTDGVAGADRDLARGADKLAAGGDRLAGSAATLSNGAGRLATGADDVSSGASSLAGSARELDQAAARLASGATSSDNAAGQLATGTASLSSGAASANQGAHQLSDGLDQLADQSPTYTKQEKKALTTVVSEPVTMSSSVKNGDQGNGWLMGVVLGIVLWLAALLGVLGHDIAQVLRHSGTPVSSRRLTMVHLRPATGLAVVQGVAVLAALALLQVGAASPVALSLLTILAAATFTLVGVALRWAFGGSGIVIFVLLLLLQAAALGNVLPIETAPAPMPTLNAALPLPAYVNGLSQLVSGGSVGSLAGVVSVLVFWGLGACLVALLVVRHRRVARAPADSAMAI